MWLSPSRFQVSALPWPERLWRAYAGLHGRRGRSPSTVLVSVQLIARPIITSIGVSGGMATIHFTSGATDLSSAFTLLSAEVTDGSYSPAVGSAITGGDGHLPGDGRDQRRSAILSHPAVGALRVAR
jgi:hypothetical protein